MKNNVTIECIDIHSHILHDVDDGPSSIGTSIEMIEKAYAEGIRTMVATPHYHPVKCTMNQEDMLERFNDLTKKVEKLHPDMKIILGREIFYTSDLLDLLESGVKLTTGDGNYLLLEYDPIVQYQYLRTSINNVVQGGYIPIIAHAERYMCLVTNWKYVVELKNMGAVIQVNAGTVIGDTGVAIKKFIKRILKERLVDIIGTDAHSNGRRAPRIQECTRYIIKKYGIDYASLLLHDNSEKILNGKYLED